jgi:hypothetical protein
MLMKTTRRGVETREAETARRGVETREAETARRRVDSREASVDGGPTARSL